MQQNEEMILSTFPNMHIQTSPAGPGCTLMSDWLTSATSPFSSGRLIATSVLAEASGIVPTTHLVQHTGKQPPNNQEKEYIERVFTCQSDKNASGLSRSEKDTKKPHQSVTLLVLILLLLPLPFLYVLITVIVIPRMGQRDARVRQ